MSKGVRSLLPNALQHETADHVPVLAEEVRELLAVQPGRDRGRRDLRRRRARRASRRRPRRPRAVHRDRPGPERAPVLRAVPAATRASRRVSCAATSPSCSASSPRTTSRPTRSCSTSASRACRSTGPSEASPTPSTRRSTCAWTRRRRRSARDVVNELERARARATSSAATARSASPARSPARSFAAAPSSRSSGRPSSSRWSGRRSPRRAASATGIRPSASSRRSDRRQRRAGGARAGAADRSSAAPSRRAPRRHQLPLARGPDRQALLRRPGARLHVPARPARVRLRNGADASSRHPQGGAALAGRDGGQPAASSARLRVAVKT